MIVDQSAFPRIAEAQSLMKQLTVLNILRDPAPADLDGASPLLISGDAQPLAKLARWLYTQGRYANALSVLATPLTSTALHAELRSRTQLLLPGGLLMVLRYFDTRALPLLPRLFAPEQYGAFVACTSAWYYLGRAGELMHLPAPQHRHAGAYPAPLLMNEAQERMLTDDGLADSVIDQLLDLGSPALHGLNPTDQYERIAPLVADAARWGLTDTLDVLPYVDTALHEGDDFSSREPWANRLQAFRSGQLPLADALQGAVG